MYIIIIINLIKVNSFMLKRNDNFFLRSHTLKSFNTNHKYKNYCNEEK